MKNFLLCISISVLSLILQGCSKDTIRIDLVDVTFVYEDPDCESLPDIEISCQSWIWFRNTSEADILLSGDIVHTYVYSSDGDRLIVLPVQSHLPVLVFHIIDDNTLRMTSFGGQFSDSIWVRSTEW